MAVEKQIIFDLNFRTSGTGADDAKAKIQELNKAFKEAGEEFGKLQQMRMQKQAFVDAAEISKSTKAAKELYAEANKIDKQIKSITQSTSLWSQTIQGARSHFIAIASFAGFQGVVSGLGNMAKAIVGAAVEAENFQTQFTTMLGSAEKAAKFIEQARNYAAVTPFETTDILGASQTLIGFGVEGRKALKVIQDLGAVAGGSGENLKGLAVVYGQVIGLGRLQAQDLNQFINRGVPLMEGLVKVTGKSAAEIKAMMEKGQVSAQIFKDALASLSAEGGRFFGNLEAQSKTLSGRWSTLKDNIGLLFTRLGQAVTPILSDLLEGAERWLRAITPERIQAFLSVMGQVASVLGTVVMWTLKAAAVWAAYRAGLIATTLVVRGLGILQAITGITTATGVLTSATNTLTVAFRALGLANPFGLILGGVTALAFAMRQLLVDTESEAVVMERLSKSISDANDELDKQKSKVEILGEAADQIIESPTGQIQKRIFDPAAYDKYIKELEKAKKEAYKLRAEIELAGREIGGVSLEQLARSKEYVDALQKSEKANTGLLYVIGEGISFVTGKTTALQENAFALDGINKINKARKIIDMANYEISISQKRATDGLNSALGKGAHLSRLKRDALEADTKAIEANTVAMTQQTKELLRQQQLIEMQQSGLSSRADLAEKELEIEEMKLRDEAALRKDAANKKLKDDAQNQRVRLAEAAKMSKDEADITTEQRVETIRKIGLIESKEERIAAIQKLNIRADLRRELLEIESELGTESAKIINAYNANIQTIERRNVEARIENFMKATVELSKANAELGNALRESIFANDEKLATRNEQSIEEARQLIKRRAQMELTALNANEDQVLRLENQLNAERLKREEIYQKQREVIGTDMDEGDKQRLLKSYNEELRLIDASENNILIRIQQAGEARRTVRIKSIQEETDAIIALSKAREDRLAKQADVRLGFAERQRRTDVFGFRALGEFFTSYKNTPEGKNQLEKIAAQREYINTIQQTLELRKKEADAGVVGAKEEVEKLKKELEAAQQELGIKVDDYSTKAVERTIKNVADGIGAVVDLTLAATQALNSIYQTQVDIIGKQAELQSQKVQETKDELNKALEEGQANRARISAEQLQLEEERLDKLNRQKEDYVRKQQALAVIELIANSTVAIAKAAAAGGPFAAVTIAATLISLAAGLAAAKAQASAAGTGFAAGGYTGDGKKYEPAGTVHKGEFVFDAETTRKNRPVFEQIHKGKLDLKKDSVIAKIAETNRNFRPHLADSIANIAVLSDLAAKQQQTNDLLGELIEAQNAQKINISNTVDSNGIATSVRSIQRKQDRRRSL